MAIQAPVYYPPLGDVALPSGETADFSVEDATTNATTDVLTVRHRTTGTAAANIGVGIVGYIEDAAGNDQIAYKLRSIYTDPTNASEDADFRIALVDAGTVPAEGSEQFRLDSDGLLTISSKLDIGTSEATSLGVTELRVFGGSNVGMIIRRTDTNIEYGLFIDTAINLGSATDHSVKFLQSSVETLTLSNLAGTRTVVIADGVNVSTGATTGTKFGDATTDKISFWNATPVVQGAAVADASGGATIDAEARTAINTLLARMRTYGLIAT